jgi:KaiC/GvpD/RAD55 family RecA-like ATPase
MKIRLQKGDADLNYKDGIDENNATEFDYEEIEVDTTTASEIESRRIAWTWPPYLPRGTAIVVIGDGGNGKSFFTLAIAAAISRGLPLPGMEKSILPPSDVIIQNGENAWPSVIKPRLEMLGADCTRIHRINENNKRLTLTDKRIEAAIRKHNAKLVVLDPIQSLLDANFSMNRSESVRPALMHLERVAERTDSTIILVGHISKGRGNAQHRGLGSVDIVNAVPSVLCLGKAEGLNSDVRAVAHLKGNYTELGKTQTFRLGKECGFSWLGEDDTITPEDIMNFNASKTRIDKTKVDDAVDFLYEILGDDALPTSEVTELASEMGISKRTLERARKIAGVKASKADGVWMLMLDDDDF